MSILKRSITTFAKISGIYRLSPRFEKGAVALFWHGVEEELIDPDVQMLHILFPQFEKQIKYLRQNFEIISLDDLHECLTNGYKIHPSQVLITFDDGYKNNVTLVAPFLNSLNIPFSVFISTKHIDKGIRFPTYYVRAAFFYTEKHNAYFPCLKKSFDLGTPKNRKRAEKILTQILLTAPQHTVNRVVEDLIDLVPSDKWAEINHIFSSDEPMTWEDAKTIHESGATIGSHCHDHFIMHSDQSQKEVDYQLKTSKDLIEKRLGLCKYFAYPFGEMDSISRDSVIRVTESDYNLGLTVVRGEIRSESNPYILPRFGAPFNVETLRFKMNTRFMYNKRFDKWRLKYE